jgi:tRNA A-37 threonylcarbamoyl transferase component Bud32
MSGISKPSGDLPWSSVSAAGTLPAGVAQNPDTEILRELGRGGMGVVYLVQNKLMGRKEVLKVVSSHLLDRKGVLERFLREIRAAAQLRHPNIVTAYAAARVGESIVFSMEYVDGYDLAELVEKKGPLPVAQACNFAYQAALGLQHAHEHGMVHRDIKPSNLMVARVGNRPVVKILDFGLAKLTSEGGVDAGLTHDGQMLGTPHYVAPEQTVDAQNAGIRADIYSLGCTLYCLLAGHPPFDAPSLFELLQAHHSMDARPLNFVRPGVPVELAAVVAKMLAKEPQRRFQTPGEVAKALVPFFKKGVGSEATTAAVSQFGNGSVERKLTDVGRALTQPEVAGAPVAASCPTTAGGAHLAETKWEQLISIDKTHCAKPAKTTPASLPSRGPLWAGLARLAGLLVVGSTISWAGWTLRVKSRIGVIELTGLPDQAEVLVDAGKVTVFFPEDGSPAEISVPPGEHSIQIKKNGFQAAGTRVSLAAGGKTRISAQLVPEAATSANPAPEVALKDVRGQPVDLERSSRAATIASGHWRIEGDEIVQSDETKIAELAFGDIAWSDYDLTLELNKAKTNLRTNWGIHVDFHRLHLGTFCSFGLGIVQNRGSELYFQMNGRRLGRKGENNDDNFVRRGIDEGRWHRVKIKVRKNKFECYLDDDMLFEESHASYTHGRIGLRTGSVQARFRKIKVTDPGGRVLFEGLPEWPADSSSSFDAPPFAVETGAAPAAEPAVQGAQARRPRGSQPTDQPSAAKPTAQMIAGSGGVVGSGARRSHPDGFVSLFNGIDLSGWDDVFPESNVWTVVGGVIVGHGTGQAGKPGQLRARRKDYSDFKLRITANYSKNGGGWIEIRHRSVNRKAGGYLITDGQFNGRVDPVGSVGRRSGDGFDWYPAQRVPMTVGEWNTIEISAVKNHIWITLNGRTVLNITDPNPAFVSGEIMIGCQPDARVQIREVLIKELIGKEDQNPAGPSKSLKKRPVRGKNAN